jgi:2-C-methyl-D-erythritol 4-phosphate cytidylyltransferase
MSHHLPAFWAVIPAAGVGARMAADRPKQYLQLGGRTILEHSLGCFLDHPNLKGLVVSLASDDPYWPTLACAADPRIQRADGGSERSGSVLNALLQLNALGASDDDWVLVHDAARPNLSRDDLDKLLFELADDPVGGLLAVPARDTLKRVEARSCCGNRRPQPDLAGLHASNVPPGCVTPCVGRQPGGRCRDNR